MGQPIKVSGVDELDSRRGSQNGSSPLSVVRGDGISKGNDGVPQCNGLRNLVCSVKLFCSPRERCRLYTSSISHWGNLICS